MLIVKATDLTVISESALRQAHKNVSFPSVLTTNAVKSFGYLIVDIPEQPVLARHQRAVLGVPYRDGEAVKVEWGIVTETPSQEEVLKGFERAIDDMLSAKAREMRYDSVYTMISYMGDPNPKFDVEARSMFAWRSAVWTQANAMMEAFAGEVGDGSELPTIEQVLNQLPAFSLLESANS